MVYIHEIHELLNSSEPDKAQMFAIYNRLTGQALPITDPNSQLVRAYLAGYVQTRVGDLLPVAETESEKPKYDQSQLKEVFDLITVPRSTKQNRRMFEIYNEMTGRSWKPCWCSSKIDTIQKHFRQLLLENGFINQ